MSNADAEATALLARFMIGQPVPADQVERSRAISADNIARKKAGG